MKKNMIKFLSLTLAGFVISSYIQYPSILLEAKPKIVVEAADTIGFINKIAPLAVKDMKESGILASVTIAQAILESGWGESTLAKESNNYFGIKASPGWNGGVTNMATQEYDPNKGYYTIVDGFRKYSDLSGSIKDHSTFLLVNSRYKGIQYQTDPLKAITLIWNAGYATDPNYISKIMGLIEYNDLTRFDKQALSELEEEMKAGKEKEKSDEVEKKVKEFEESEKDKVVINPIAEPSPDENTVSSQDNKVISIEEAKVENPVIEGRTGIEITKEDVIEANTNEVLVTEVLENKKEEQPKADNQLEPTTEESSISVSEDASAVLEKESLTEGNSENNNNEESLPKVFESEGISVKSKEIPNDYIISATKVTTRLDLAYDISFSDFLGEKQNLENIDARVSMIVDSKKQVDKVFFIDKDGKMEDISDQIISKEKGKVIFKATHFSVYGVMYVKEDENGDKVNLKIQSTAERKISDSKIEKEESKNIEEKSLDTSKPKSEKRNIQITRENKKSKEVAPKTGDFANYLVYIVIIIVCLVCLAYIIFTGKNNSGKKKK